MKICFLKVCKAFCRQIKSCHPKMQLFMTNLLFWPWKFSALPSILHCSQCHDWCVRKEGRNAVLAQAAQKFGSRVEDGEACRASRYVWSPNTCFGIASLAVQCQNKDRSAYIVQGVETGTQDFCSPTWTLHQPASASLTISNISEAITEITRRTEMAKGNVWAPPLLVCKGARL